MEKNTRENIEKNYREAIIKKYRSEKVDGKYSHYLDNPSQALLRNLCWEVFSLSPKENDLVVYRNFFRFDFNSKDEDTSITYTNKFKKVGAFLRGHKVPAKITTVELAAILVDYEPRPFKKFKEKGIPIIEQPIDSPKIPFAFGIKDGREEEIEIEGNEIEKKNGNYQEEQIANFENEKKNNYDEEKEKSATDLSNLNEDKKNINSEEVEIITVDNQPSRLSLFLKIKEKILKKFLNRLKNTVIVTVFIFGLIITVIYFSFFKNHCMQWSEDHYEVVDCSPKNGKNTNEIIPLDNDLLDFKKLKVCDTTICFKKNGEGSVWYVKTPNGIDFFNDNGSGRHPESKKSLRPVSKYIFDKYVKGKSCE